VAVRYICLKDSTDLTDEVDEAVRGRGDQGGLRTLSLALRRGGSAQRGQRGPGERFRVVCPTCQTVNMFTLERSGADDRAVPGEAPTATEAALFVSAETLAPKESDSRLKEVGATLLAQLATLGAIAGAFTLAPDATKQEFVKEPDLLTVVAAAGALAFALALASLIAPPWRIKSLDFIRDIEGYFNRRLLIRRVLLSLSLLALLIGAGAAVELLRSGARRASQEVPHAAIDAKLTPGTSDSLPLLVATSSLTDLKPGASATLCITGPEGTPTIARRTGTADRDGMIEFSATAPVPNRLDRVLVTALDPPDVQSCKTAVHNKRAETAEVEVRDPATTPDPPSSARADVEGKVIPASEMAPATVEATINWTDLSPFEKVLACATVDTSPELIARWRGRADAEGTAKVTFSAPLPSATLVAIRTAPSAEACDDLETNPDAAKLVLNVTR
jgi:hypothetical protein